MGKVVSMMARPIRNYNVEQRAHKVISKEKPIPAPQYEATARQLKLTEKFEPEFKKKQYEKNTKLDTHLKNVFVVSSDPVPDLSSRSDPSRPLPKTRQMDEYIDLNLYQVQNVREGRCSLEQLQTILTNYMDNPQKYNAAHIADQYQLDVKVVEHLLEYYKVFRILSKDDIDQIKEEKGHQELLQSNNQKQD